MTRADIEFTVMLISIFGGFVWNHVGLHQLTGRVDRIGDDLKQFYRDLGRHDKAIEILENKR